MINFCSTYCNEVPKPSIMLLNLHFKNCSTYLSVLLNNVYKAIQGMSGKPYPYNLQTCIPKTRMSILSYHSESSR